VAEEIETFRLERMFLRCRTAKPNFKESLEDTTANLLACQAKIGPLA
jgi:hypothetical protein